MRVPILSPLKLALLSVVLFGRLASADVKLPAVFSNNMVLQQGTRVAIWGWADPDEQVTITLGGQRGTARADRQGQWKTALGPFEAGGPFEMTVAGRNSITLHDILVGEVWVCSGQSNMEMSVGREMPGWKSGVLNFEQEIASAHYPRLRMFTVKKTVAGQPRQDVEGQWEEASPVTVAHFSAVAYFFGRELFETLGVPIGLIHTSWGGTPAESWMSKAALESDPEFKPILDKWNETSSGYAKQLNEFQKQLDDWKEVAQQAEAAGKPIPPAPTLPGDPRSSPWRPSGLYNAMIAPLLPYAIRGAIWYQGESNSDRGIQYRKLFPTMIRDWRQAWGLGDFPFLYVQLANFRELPPRLFFPLVREAQVMTLSLPKTGMAVTIDIGDPDDIHPKNKQEVGRRLALAARAIAHKEKIEYSGPMYKAMKRQGGAIRLSFTHAKGMKAQSGEPGGFLIAGADKQFVPAKAEIRGSTVVVRADEVKEPVAVRYSWAENPIGNLVNKECLPASPFKTDGTK